MTTITRSASKRKAETLATPDLNNEPKRLLQSFCDDILDDQVTADEINARKRDIFPTSPQLVSLGFVYAVRMHIPSSHSYCRT